MDCLALLIIEHMLFIKCITHSESNRYMPSSLNNRYMPSSLNNRYMPSSLNDRYIPSTCSLNNRYMPSSLSKVMGQYVGSMWKQQCREKMTKSTSVHFYIPKSIIINY